MSGRRHATDAPHTWQGGASEALPSRVRWAVIGLRRDGTIASWDAGARALYGLPASRTVGRHYLEFANPANRARIGETLQAVFHGAPAVSLVVPVRRSDGTAVMTAWTVIPTREPSGEVTGVLATAIPLPDVSPSGPEQGDEVFWREVFDANPMAVAVTDGRARILGLNARFTELFGYDEAAVLGRSIVTLLGAEDDAAHVAARRIAVGERIALDGEREARTGERVRLHIEAAAFAFEDGRRGYVVTYRRAADQQAFEAHVARAQRLEVVALLASGVLHDVNNLLGVVLAQADLLADGLPGLPLDPAHRQELDVLREAARRAAALARTVGSFARPRDVRPEVVDLCTLIERLRPVLVGVVGRQIAVHCDLDPAARPVCAVPGELEQVVVNLAANARDAMPDGGTLRVRVAGVRLDAAAAARYRVPPGPYVALDVADTGTGMPAEVVGRAFEPFFTTKGDAGTGLGLATVERVVRRTGGAVAIQSAAGAGTTVQALLPVHRPAGGA